MSKQIPTLQFTKLFSFSPLSAQVLKTRLQYQTDLGIQVILPRRSNYLAKTQFKNPKILQEGRLYIRVLLFKMQYSGIS